MDLRELEKLKEFNEGENPLIIDEMLFLDVEISYATMCGRVLFWEREVQSVWKKRQRNGFKDSVVIRMKHLGIAVFSPLMALVDMGIGIGSGAVELWTLRRRTPFISASKNLEEGSRLFVALFYANLLRALNPNAGFLEEHHEGVRDCRQESLSYYFGDGLVRASLIKRISCLGRSLNFSESIFHRQISSRLTYVLLALAVVITRAVEVIFGMVAAFFSLIFLGKVASLNRYAYRGLQATGMIGDVSYCVFKMIYPCLGESSHLPKK
jgi:hypothetical protein